MPKSGPHIAAISVLTPYEQIVERAGTYKNYSAQDAAQDFTNQPGEIRVRIEIRLTPTYSQLVGTESGVPVPRGEDFWNDFEFRLRQNEKILSRLQTESEAVYAGNSAGIIGANVFMRYKCEDVAALPVTVQVLTPDGQRVEAVFDLATLR